MKKIINFKCELECGGKCCVGATHILPEEVHKFMDKSPLLPNIFVLNHQSLKHDKKLLHNIKRSSVSVTIENEITGQSQKAYLFVDFMMGAYNSYSNCMLLEDGKCTVHETGKPLKCKLMPISPLVPESHMYYPYDRLRDTCQGVKNSEETSCTVWKNGKLTNKEDAKNLREYFSSLERSKSFTSLFLSICRELDESFDGIIEKLNNNSMNGETETSFETTFFPDEELLSLIGVKTDDYIESQLMAFEKFKSHDPVAFENSITLNTQYKLLKAMRDSLE